MTKVLLEKPLDINDLTPENLAARLSPETKEGEADTKPNKRYVVFFHDDADGWGSAGIALNGLTEPGRIFVMLPVNYSDNHEDIVDKLLPEDHVYVLDFSFKREICDAIYEKVESFVVLDHHKTAKEALEGAPYATFDMTKSGVLLTYEHFFKDMLSHEYESVPIPVRLLDNYDLWKKDDPNVDWSWVVGMHLYVIDYFGDFEFWRELMAMVDLTPQVFGILKQKYEDFKTTIDELTKSAEFVPVIFNPGAIDITGHGIKGVFYPASDHISLLADAVRSGDHKPDFTASYHINVNNKGEKKVIVSLRGSEHFNVDKIAKLCGGGGHEKAAGFSFPIEKEGGEDVYVNIDNVISKVQAALKTIHEEAEKVKREPKKS